MSVTLLRDGMIRPNGQDIQMNRQCCLRLARKTMPLICSRCRTVH